MSIFKHPIIYGEALLDQEAGLSLKEVIETKAKALATRAPVTTPQSYLSVQSDGTTLRMEIESPEIDLADEPVLRQNQGDIYANSLQRRASHAIENISRSEMAIRDLTDSLQELRERQNELLIKSTDYYLYKREAARGLFIFLAVALGEIGAMFFQFADIFGIDPLKMGSELRKHTFPFIFTTAFTVSFFAATLYISNKVISVKEKIQQIYWFICLFSVSLVVANIRATQATSMQEIDFSPLLLTALYIIIGIVLPLTAAVYARKWREASQRTGLIDSTERRMSELETKTVQRLQEAVREREQWNGRLDELNEEYVTHYQKAVKDKDDLNTAWEVHRRHTDANLAELRLAYLFWEGWRSKGTHVPGVIKKAALITAVLILVLIFTLLSCHASHAETPFNLLVLCDRSTSASDISCSSQSVQDAGRYWIKKADDAEGGTFQLFLIDQGFDSTTILFSESYPERFPGPVSAHKKKWRTDFLARLCERTKEMPKNTGSAIVQAIHRSSLRITASGETIIYVMSDMRQVDDTFNFERRVPSEKEFLHWIDAKAITPKFGASTKLVACGVHPYTPAHTSRMTTENYDRLLKLWRSVFAQWGVKATISEACSLNYME